MHYQQNPFFTAVLFACVDEKEEKYNRATRFSPHRKQLYDMVTGVKDAERGVALSRVLKCV